MNKKFRSRILYSMVAGLLLVAGDAGAAEPAADAQLVEQAGQRHQRIIALDSHVDLPFDYPGAAADGKTQIELPKVARGLCAQTWPVEAAQPAHDVDQFLVRRSRFRCDDLLMAHRFRATLADLRMPIVNYTSRYPG